MAAGDKGLTAAGGKSDACLRNGLRVCVREMGDDKTPYENQRAGVSR